MIKVFTNAIIYWLKVTLIFSSVATNVVMSAGVVDTLHTSKLSFSFRSNC